MITREDIKFGESLVELLEKELCGTVATVEGLKELLSKFVSLAETVVALEGVLPEIKDGGVVETARQMQREKDLAYFAGKIEGLEKILKQREGFYAVAKYFVNINELVKLIRTHLLGKGE